MSTSNFRFAYLGSGSRGNGALIQFRETTILVDCGFMLREAEKRLRRLGVEPRTLSAIVVTHEHADHIGGVGRLARKHGIPVYVTRGTFQGWEDHRVGRAQHITPHEAFTVGDLEVQPFPVPHDAREPCQYVFSDGDRRVGVLSDAGSVTAHMRQVLSGLDALLLEFNHDVTMLANGPYPPKLQERVGGPYGHLSNDQAAGLLRAVDVSRLQHLALIHLSQKNNTPELAARAAAEALNCAPSELAVAHQDYGLDWRQVY